MRRGWLCIAMLLGLLLPCALPAAPTQFHAKKAHASGAARRSSAATSHHAKPEASAGRVSRSGAKVVRASSPFLLRRKRSGSAQLQTTQPVMTALIDPVPRGHFAVPPPLKGSHESLVRQNVRSDEEGLTRIQDDADLLVMRRDGELVGLPTSPALVVDERLPANRRYCRAWTAQFLVRPVAGALREISPGAAGQLGGADG